MRYAHWLFALAGFSVCILDYVLFEALEVEMVADGERVNEWVMLFYGLSFAAFGYVAGRLLQMKKQSEHDAATIRIQLEEIETQKRAAFENEKLAAIGRLAAGVAHEVRNPLGVIKSSASLLREDFDADSESAKACAFIVEETDRLNQLITALLAFSRPARLNRQSTAVPSMVERAVQLASETLEAHRVDVVNEACSNELKVDADPDLLSQVVLDLVINAAEAAGEGGKVHIRAEQQAKGVVLDVADSGPGVDEDIRDKLFEPFFTTKATGTGLGLCMAAKIVQAHGGTLELVPGGGAGDGGRGACFRLRVPDRQAA